MKKKMRKPPKANMFVPKCALVILFIFLKYSNQISIKSEISEIIDNNATSSTSTSTHDYSAVLTKSVPNVKQSFSHCLEKQTNEVIRCFLKQSILSMNSAIENNDTWHITDYLSVIKNGEWQKPVANVGDAREFKSVFSVFLNKINELVESRSVQFKIPHKDREARKYAISSLETGK